MGQKKGIGGAGRQKEQIEEEKEDQEEHEKKERKTLGVSHTASCGVRMKAKYTEFKKGKNPGAKI